MALILPPTSSISLVTASISLSLALMLSLTAFRCFLVSSRLASLDLTSLTFSLEALRASISLINFFSSVKLMDVVSCRFWSFWISFSISSTELNRTEDLASFLSWRSLSMAFLSKSSSARMLRFSSMSLPFFWRRASMASLALPISVFLPEDMVSSIFFWTFSLSFLSSSNLAFNSLSLASCPALSGFSTRGMGWERSKSSSMGVSSFFRLFLPLLLSAFSSVTGAGAAGVAASSAMVIEDSRQEIGTRGGWFVSRADGMGDTLSTRSTGIGISCSP
mmetsp:Transcript_18144/g.50488  ORF Transcript_18144/g.50488 Transcript_18144/m.50488 type:complete len:277 (+) Transcript_18144:767-1597(+)